MFTFKRILLALFVLFSFYGDFYLLTQGEIDAMTFVGIGIILGFQIGSISWLYCDIIGWDKFDNTGWGFIFPKRKKG